MKLLNKYLMLGGILSFSMAAFADNDAGVYIAPETVEPELEESDVPEYALMAGFGVTDFAMDDTNGVTDTGATWDVRAQWGADSIVGAEAAYVGSARNADSPFFDATLQAHGVEAAARVQPLETVVSPFATAGIGWTRYSLGVDTEQLSVPVDDDVMTVPLSVGIAVEPTDSFVLDIRAQYKFALDDEAFAESMQTQNLEELDTWSVTARAGVEF